MGKYELWITYITTNHRKPISCQFVGYDGNTPYSIMNNVSDEYLVTLWRLKILRKCPAPVIERLRCNVPGSNIPLNLNGTTYLHEGLKLEIWLCWLWCSYSQEMTKTLVKCLLGCFPILLVSAIAFHLMFSDMVSLVCYHLLNTHNLAPRESKNNLRALCNMHTKWEYVIFMLSNIF